LSKESLNPGKKEKRVAAAERLTIVTSRYRDRYKIQTAVHFPVSFVPNSEISRKKIDTKSIKYFS
jgi:hypothetical protein